MTALTKYTEDLIARHLAGSTTWTKPGGIFLAGFEVMPDDTGAGGTEATYSGYARNSIAQLDANWTPSSIANGYQVANAIVVDLPTPTATDGNDIVGIGFYNALTGGDLLCYGTLTGGNITPTNGVPIDWQIGDLVVSWVQTDERFCDPFTSVVLDHMFRTDTWAKPSAITTDLMTTMPNKAGAGGVAYAGNGYAIPTVGPNVADWDFTTPGDTVATHNKIASFGTPTADWTGIDGHVLRADGVVFMKLDYADAPRTYQTGADVRFQADTLAFSVA